MIWIEEKRAAEQQINRKIRREICSVLRETVFFA